MGISIQCTRLLSWFLILRTSVCRELGDLQCVHMGAVLHIVLRGLWESGIHSVLPTDFLLNARLRGWVCRGQRVDPAVLQPLTQLNF